MCAESVAPAEVGVWALHAGLHGVVLTDHDVLWEQEEVAMLQQACRELRFFRGIECSAQGAHLVVIGIDDAGFLHRGVSINTVIEFAHAHNAAVILAHPYRDSAPEELPLGSIDAIEVASTSFAPQDSERALRLAYARGMPRVAASDAHALSRIGWAWTEFPRMPADELDLAAMIKQGLGVPALRHAAAGGTAQTE